MSQLEVLVEKNPASTLFAEFDSRDAAVWLMNPFLEAVGPEAAAKLLSLPWAFVLSESSDPKFVASMEGPETPDNPLVRRRGIVHIVDTNPADLNLPPRSLPVFLLNGRVPQRMGLAALTRRLTMLNELERRAVRSS
jgi:hypothetical protein